MPNFSSYPIYMIVVENKQKASILDTWVGGTVIENMLPRLNWFSEVGKGRWPGPREYWLLHKAASQSIMKYRHSSCRGLMFWEQLEEIIGLSVFFKLFVTTILGRHSTIIKWMKLWHLSGICLGQLLSQSGSHCHIGNLNLHFNFISRNPIRQYLSAPFSEP